MFANRAVLHVVTITTLCAGCAVDEPAAPDRARAIAELARTAGPLQTDDQLIAPLTGRLSAPAADPARAAERFVAAHRELFALAGDDLVVSNVDVDPFTQLRHVTLQRTVDGVPVYHGATTLHLDADNAIFRILGDGKDAVGAPRNHRVLSPLDAIRAAAVALAAPITAPRALSATRFTDPRASDDIAVEPRIYPVAPGDARHAYQVILQWQDPLPHAELAVIDADDASLLARASLVDDAIPYAGVVFTASPGAAPVADTRVLVPFGDDPLTSPFGWVDVTEKTRGNNAIVATDLDHDNVVGPGETQPAADPVTKVFNSTYSPVIAASSLKEASVISAFYLINDFHDRTYRYGFTEAAGNHQTNNFGKGGTGNDEVQVDTQDGGGSNNAFYQSVPDGMRPRMTLFAFSLAAGVQRDSAFDPSVIYHEATHGLAHRLVGGGTGACLGGVQSAGMGEGWGDFVAASFLGDPVIGAYVSGNAATGVRTASMAASPFRYDNIQDGTMTEAHAAGEIWAAALWDARTAIGAATLERLVVNAMKLTPCNPSMVTERDAILNADAVINASANRCALWTAFAGRGLGTGASSPNHNATVTVVTSTTVPADCGGANITRSFRSAGTPLAIPDNSAVGSAATIGLPAIPIQRVQVDVAITHPFRGDLVVQVIPPVGRTVTLTNRAGGSADNFVTVAQDITSAFTPGTSASGSWRLFVRDLATGNTGTITNFRVTITSP